MYSPMSERERERERERQTDKQTYTDSGKGVVIKDRPL